LQAW
ncbi:hypothetical protein MK372_05605, partial [Streptococcus oralis]